MRQPPPVRRDAEQAVALIEGWQPPFSSGLETWRPDSPGPSRSCHPGGYASHGDPSPGYACLPPRHLR